MLREPHFGEENTSVKTRPSGDIKILKSLWPLVSPHMGMMIVVILSVMLAACMVIGLGIGLQFLVDYGFSQRNMRWLDKTLVGLFFVVLLMATASFARLYSVAWVGERVVTDLRKKIFEHLLQLDTTFFESTSIGEIQSRLTTDTTLLQVVICTSLPIAIRNLLIIGGGIVMLLITSLGLTKVIAFLIPFILTPILVLGKRVRRYSRDTQDQTAGISTRLDETFSFIRTVRAFCREPLVKEQFSAQLDNTMASSMIRVKARAWMTAIVMVFVFGGISFVLWLGGIAVIKHEMTAGELSSFLFYAIAVAGSFGSLSEIHGDIQRAAGAMERILEFLALQPTMKISLKPKVLETMQGDIFIDDVVFSYPSRPQHQVINHMTFRIHAGETVALVGPSGGGKTTLFHLILRFYDPDNGTILIDGIPIVDMDPTRFREHIAIVSQEPSLFSTTVRDNIAFGVLGATEEEIVRAAQSAYAHDFIKALPHGYETLVGEKGVQLSGGQRQRIAIARAILRNPKILLLDEATSALDAHAETQVQQALVKLMEGRTTLVIAHRLSTVQNADRIIVLDEGKIVGCGHHRELIQEEGLYKNLVQSQLSAA